MAFLDQEFNVNELPVSTSQFDPLPEGWYNVSIANAEIKDTKTAGGQYIKMEYVVTGPSHQGRKVWGNLNIKNANPKAEKIGRQQLGEVMQAIGLVKVTDTDQLIGGNLAIKLIVKQDEKYGAGNDIKGFKSTGTAIASVPSAASAPAPAKGSPPWAKK